MKPFIALMGLLVVFAGCRKSDLNFIRGKLMKCDIAEQANVGNGYTIGVGFVKTYYTNGLVKTVRTKTLDAFNNFDSSFFNFTYSGNVAKVTGSSLNYQYHSDGMGGDVHYTNDLPAVIYDFEVTFDQKTFNATQAGTTIFHYDANGRLIAYNGFTLLYDDKGNVQRIHGDGEVAVVYEYDYTKTAKQQLYYTTGFFTNDMFNLMEILGWIPVSPKNIRTKHILSLGVDDGGEDVLFGTFYFTEQTVQDGLLTSFKGSFADGPSDVTPTTNKWNCKPVFKGHVKE